MEVKTILANEENANIIKNMYPLYLHDLSEFYGNIPNEYGIYETEHLKTLAEQYDVQNIWFQKPDELFPFIIMVDGKPAGFDLVSTGKYAPKEMEYYLYESFLLRPYRGKDIGSIAAKQVFDRFLGKWGLHVAPNGTNPRAEGFWRKTITAYTKDNFQEKQCETFDGFRRVFTFNNKEQ